MATWYIWTEEETEHLISNNKYEQRQYLMFKTPFIENTYTLQLYFIAISEMQLLFCKKTVMETQLVRFLYAVSVIVPVSAFQWLFLVAVATSTLNPSNAFHYYNYNSCSHQEFKAEPRAARFAFTTFVHESSQSPIDSFVLKWERSHQQKVFLETNKNTQGTSR